ncbi:MAG: cyclic nucleotide-binding domain-containing protein [Myxococcota bacterium]
MHWPLLVGTVALLLLAGVVNRVAPAKRRLLRGVVILWGLWGLAAVTRGIAARAGAEPAWLATAEALAQAWYGVAFLSLVLFEITLPALRVHVLHITSELVRGGAFVAVTMAVLTAAGLDFTSVVAASTVAAAVLTMSLQATLGNVLGGVVLQAEGSVRPGDWIQLEGGRQGKVREVRWRHTTVSTRDGDVVLVPNASLLGGAFSILGMPHRMWVHFHVDFRYAPDRVVRVVTEALRASPMRNVAASPAPDCICLDLARDSYAHYAVRYWLTDLAADEPTSSVVRGRVHAALRRADIPLARPSGTYFNIAQDDGADAAREERRRARAHATLRGLELFAPLTAAETEALAAQLVFAPFSAGETITREGAVAHWLYILHSGVAEVRASGLDEAVARLEGPDFFGEMGLLTGEPRRADVVAASDVVCYRLDKVAFDRVIRARPEVAAEVSAVLARRRTALDAKREGVPAAEGREHTERARILGQIRAFFGIDA